MGIDVASFYLWVILSRLLPSLDEHFSTASALETFFILRAFFTQDEMLTRKSYSPRRPPTSPSLGWPYHMSFDSLSFHNSNMVEHRANLH